MIFKKKKKQMDANEMPIKDRIENLENTAAENEESRIALLEAIDRELDKISECVEKLPCKRSK